MRQGRTWIEYWFPFTLTEPTSSSSLSLTACSFSFDLQLQDTPEVRSHGQAPTANQKTGPAQGTSLKGQLTLRCVSPSSQSFRLGLQLRPGAPANYAGEVSQLCCDQCTITSVLDGDGRKAAASPGGLYSHAARQQEHLNPAPLTILVDWENPGQSPCC